MTARWMHKPWTALVLVSLGLGLTVFVAVTFAGERPARMPEVAAGLQATCNSCAARNQHMTRLSAAKETGVSP